MAPSNLTQCIIFLIICINADPLSQFKDVWVTLEVQLVNKSYQMIIFPEYLGKNPFAPNPNTNVVDLVKSWRSSLDTDDFAHTEASKVTISSSPLAPQMTVLADFDSVLSYTVTHGQH